MEDETSGMDERTNPTEARTRAATETTRGSGEPSAPAPYTPSQEEIERARQRALKVFRYGAIAFFLLLGLIALLLHLQGVLWIAFQLLAAGVFFLVLLSLPFLLLGGLLVLLLRRGRRDEGAGGGGNPGRERTG